MFTKLLLLLLVYTSCSSNHVEKPELNYMPVFSDSIPILPSDSLNKIVKEKCVLNARIESVQSVQQNTFLPDTILNNLFLKNKIIAAGQYIYPNMRYHVFEFYYPSDRSNAYSRIIEKLKITSDANYVLYHDFLKRGIVFLKEGNKLIMIMYNPFSNRKIHTEMERFLQHNKSKFTSISTIHGFGTLKVIK